MRSFSMLVILLSLAVATSAPSPLAAVAAAPADAVGLPRDICGLLGGRADRDFAGRPGNLSAVVGGKPRLIYMAGDLSLKTSMLQGKVLEWRPDYVELRPGVLAGADGMPVDGVSARRFCWVGANDSLMMEEALRNTSTTGRVVRLTFDLQGVADLKEAGGGWTFKVQGGYPTSLIPELFGVLRGTHAVQVVDGKLRVDVPVDPGASVSCVLGLALVADRGGLDGPVNIAADARGESTRYWNRMLTAEIPAFKCSEAYLEKLYYFRWWSLLAKMNVGGRGHWSRPLAREGVVGFNALISYSGAPSTIDLRWMRSPDWAYGNVQSFYGNLHDGKLANHIYPDALDGDVANRAPGANGAPTDFPYHNFLVKALADVYALHPDKGVLRELWPALQRATGLYDRELDADHDGLYETYPWSNITGQEWCARFLYFHPFDQLLSYERTWRPKDDADAAETAEKIERSVTMRPGTRIARTAVGMLTQVEQDRHYRQETLDENCYAYADMKAMASIAELVGDRASGKRWLAASERTRGLVLRRLWDPASGFFYDRDGVTKEWALVKSPTGFYPFWAGIGKKEHVAIFKHLFNPAEFWTAFPVTTLSMDYPSRAELRRIGWTYWNGSNWPMTTCHVVDAAARAAKELDASLAPMAAELLMRYVKVHFIEGDLGRPCVSEYFDPVTGQANVPKLDYAHSYFIDIVMRHVVGIEADPLSDEVRVAPLDLGLSTFEARNVRVKGHDLAVTWDGRGLTVTVDGRVAARASKLKPVKLRLKAP